MNSTDLLELIGEADAEYVHDAKTPQKNHPWVKWAALAAACLALVIGLGWLLYPGTHGWHLGAAAPYPYNDSTVLEYTGSILDDLNFLGETIVMNEIGETDMDMLRLFSTVYPDRHTPHYDTRTPLYNILADYPISGDSDVITFHVFRKDGEFSGSPSYDRYLELDETHGRFTQTLYDLSGEFVRSYYLKEKEILGIYTYPLTNCTFSMLIGENLCGLDPRLDAMLPILDGSTGNTASSVSGVDVVVSYFYQTRLYREETMEESYLYFAYFEIDGNKYLCQFSSNWTLPGQTVSAEHNPPQILAYASSQENYRTRFAEMLIKIISALQ